MSTVVSDEKATAKTAPKEYRQFIGGEWVGASNGATYPDRNPFTGEPMATIPASTREDAKRAVKAAADAFPAWWKTPPGVKQRLFLKAADILERRQMEVVGLLAAETGCTFGFGMFQTIFTPNLLRQAASLPYHPTGEILPADLPGAFYMAIRQPVGVAAVLADAELEYAVNATAFGTFLHQGQICMSARRIIVERSIAKEFTDRLVTKTKGLKVGSPTEPDTIIGPLINKQAVEQVKARVDEAVAHGAKVLTGGHAQGACYEPTLLTDVPDDVQMSKEETFGPVATITIVDSADEAVDVANRTSYGLAAGILTRNADRALSLAERIQSGIVHINDQPDNDEQQVHFGGVKDSGYGRFGGSEAVHEFTEMRWVTVQSLGRAFPF